MTSRLYNLEDKKSFFLKNNFGIP